MPAKKKPAQKQSRKFLILSIDGGGVRGIIPATILTSVEKMIKAKTGDADAKIGDYFDFIAGTSTGGIMTCILLLPDNYNSGKALYSAVDAKNFYKTYGEEIFDCSIWQRISSARGLADEKYNARALESVLKNYFKDITLQDLIKPCLITGYDVRKYRPVFFNKVDASEPKSNYLIREVARATSAAPTFFEPAMPESLDKIPNASPVVDGGTFANNPAACAMVEAVKKGYGKNRGVRLEDIVILSLGTGRQAVSIRYDECKDWGLIGWARPLIGILMEGVSQTVDYQLKNLFNSLNMGDQYLRIDGQFGDYQKGLDISGLNPAMDCATRENLEKLSVFGDQLAQNYHKQLKAFVNKYF